VFSKNMPPSSFAAVPVRLLQKPSLKAAFGGRPSVKWDLTDELLRSPAQSPERDPDLTPRRSVQRILLDKAIESFDAVNPRKSVDRAIETMQPSVDRAIETMQPMVTEVREQALPALHRLGAEVTEVREQALPALHRLGAEVANAGGETFAQLGQAGGETVAKVSSGVSLGVRKAKLQAFSLSAKSDKFRDWKRSAKKVEELSKKAPKGVEATQESFRPARRSFGTPPEGLPVVVAMAA
jgi:hypothetical protein